MNREFIVKMVKAKKLELEAIQELLPDKVKASMNDMGDAMKELAKECIMELYFSGKADLNKEGKTESPNTEDENGKRNNGKEQKPVKKITIE